MNDSHEITGCPAVPKLYGALIDQAALAAARGADSRIDLTVLQLKASDTTTAIFHDQEDQ